MGKRSISAEQLFQIGETIRAGNHDFGNAAAEESDSKGTLGFGGMESATAIRASQQIAIYERDALNHIGIGQQVIGFLNQRMGIMSQRGTWKKY